MKNEKMWNIISKIAKVLNVIGVIVVFVSSWAIIYWGLEICLGNVEYAATSRTVINWLILEAVGTLMLFL